MEPEPEPEDQEQLQIEKRRRQIANRIAFRSDQLIDALFAIAEDPDADSRSRLTAIGMLLDRGIPKLGVDHTKMEEAEEPGSRKAIREEIERLLRGDDDDDDGDGALVPVS